MIDDSAFMRKALSLMLEGDPNIEIAGIAKDGEEGYNLVKKLQPDLVTLDIEMPVMDGLTALKLIMKNCPTSVLMVSSLTTEGADSTLKALEYGAVDFIPKELSFVNVNIVKIKEDLIRKVKDIVYHSWNTKRIEKTSSSSLTSSVRNKITGALPNIGYKAIALGISTGGPISLQKVLPNLNEKTNIPIFIVQHMPPKFTKSMADRLNSLSKLHVKEAEHNEVVKKGVIYIAPGGFHMTLKNGNAGNIQINISENPDSTLHRPSVDVMLLSILEFYGKKALGVIMTGMGKDGLEGISKLKKLGGYCMAQEENSCVVYGMPKSIVDAGLADAVVPLENIAEKINKVV